MHHLVCAFVAASLLLSPLSVVGKQNQKANAYSSQKDPNQHQSVCEHVRITLNSGRKIDADSYKHEDDHVEIIKKNVSQSIADKDIHGVEVHQGDCPDVVVMLKTGAKVQGYRRDVICHDRYDCRMEIKQKGKVLTIAHSDINTVGLRFKKTLSERLKMVALAPLIPFIYLILAIACRNGCDDL
jgi:hypothetical protein